jgi:hypothetical protein
MRSEPASSFTKTLRRWRVAERDSPPAALDAARYLPHQRAAYEVDHLHGFGPYACLLLPLHFAGYERVVMAIDSGEVCDPEPSVGGRHPPNT